MPLVFTRDQIKSYLQELGYGELSDENLDHFIHDLKKLIRHESKQRHRLQKENQARSDVTTTSRPESEGQSRNAKDKANQVQGASSIEAPARTVRQESVGPGGRGSTKNKSGQTENSKEQPATPGRPGSEHQGASTKNKRAQNENAKDQQGTPGRSESNGQNRKGKDKRGTNEKSKETPATTDQPESAGQGGNSSRKKWSQRVDSSNESDSTISDSSSSSSSIPSGSTISSLSDQCRYTGKWDPVSRYHYYKALWDRQKAPGEDRHMQLRWNVRAGTMGRVPCDPFGVQIKYLRPTQLRLGPEKSGKQLCCIKSCV